MGQKPDNILKPLIRMDDDPCKCWRWLGKISKTGYGCKQTNGNTVLAHRWVYQIFNGWIPPDRVIDHLCRNRWCVNPSHLEVVPMAVNSRRGSKTKLTEAQVGEIHSLLAVAKWGDRKRIAKKFGVSPALISDIKYGRAWRVI